MAGMVELSALIIHPVSHPHKPMQSNALFVTEKLLLILYTKHDLRETRSRGKCASLERAEHNAEKAFVEYVKLNLSKCVEKE